MCYELFLMFKGTTTGSSLFRAAPLVLAGLAVVLAAAATAGKKKSPDCFPLEDVKAGMKGYGLSVFYGRDPEKFDVEVLSVIHQFLPKQDLILVRCSHPVTDHAGVLAGMSGSPVYFDGKFAGAVAYAWKFGKDPIAGVTPAEDMLPYLSLPNLPVKEGQAKGVASVLKAPFPSAGKAAPPSKDGGFWDLFDAGGTNALVPVTTPLTGSLLQGGHAMTIVEKELSRFFMAPAQGGSFPVQAGTVKGGKKGKTEGEKKTPLQPGGVVAIQLVRGDLDLSGSGTVTAVQGSKALAFGHPMFNFGELEVPVTGGYVHHCLASLMFSFKMTEPEGEAGALVLDRQAGIMVDMDRKAHVVPLRIHLKDDTRGLEEDWSMEVAHHRMLTPSLVYSAITSAVDKFSPDIQDVVVEATYKVDIKGHKPLVLEEKVFQETGTYSLSYSQPLAMSLEALITSDFEKVRIDGVEADIALSYGYGKANISGAYLSSEQAEEGDRVDVYVFVKSPQASEQIYSTSFKVPGGTAGKTLNIDIKPGDEAAPDTVIPQDLDDVIDNLSKSYPSDAIVVEVQLPGQGVAINGKIIKNLPASALDTLSPKGAVIGEETEAVVERTFIHPGKLIDGSVKLKLKVKGQGEK
jgi:hypothetical protein